VNMARLIADPVAAVAAATGAGFVASLALTPLMRRLALKVGIVDRPNVLKIHAAPTAYLGGVAVLLALLIALAVMELSSVGAAAGSTVRVFAALAGASLLVAGVGLADDVREVRPVLRVAVHTAAAAALVAGCGPFAHLGPPVASNLFTIVFVVGCINAMNLLDGMDGLASGVAMVAAAAFAALMVRQGDLRGALMAGAFAAVVGGFLPYNFHPASIFLGDAGSGLLGLVLAALAVRCSATASDAMALPVALLILGVPVLDTSLAVWRRVGSRQPVSAGDRRHIYDVLMQAGLGQRVVWALLCGLAAALAASAVLLSTLPPAASLPPLAVVLIAVTWMVNRLQLWRYPNGCEHS